MDHNAKAPGRPGFAPSTSPVYSIQREGGSVRRARERVEAGLVSQEARSGLDGGNRNLGYPDNLQGSQDSQWPLVSHGDSTRKRNNSPTGNRPHGQGRAPQRPPRPVYVPGILDASHEPDGSSNFPPQQPLDHFQRPQDHQPANSWDPSYSSTRREPGTPGTTGTGFSATSGSLSRPSTSSSVGTIPEFPVPVVPFSATPQQTRRGANLGPPPSSRRGASSYYSQSSYVTPIMEEQYEPGIHSHGSFASSHVIPASWGDESLGSFAPAEENLAGTTEKGPDLRSTGHDDSSDLAHSASSGKPHKPSLATLRSTDNAEESDTTGVGGGSVAASEKPPRFSRAAGETGGPVAAALGTTKDDPMGLDSDGGTGRTAFLDTPSSSNSSINKNFDNLTAESVAAHAEAKDRSSPEDPRVRQILGGLEKGGAIKAGTPLPLTTSPTDQSGKVLKRPNRLNVDAARETDSRGSLTSLPDLIRRATKLASNLDRGRTASRLGMLEILGGSDSEKNNSPLNPNRRSGSISDMLASFPPPGLATPTQERSGGRWPSPLGQSNLHDTQSMPPATYKPEGQGRRPGRRCCGMPLWVFVLLLILLVLAITAAIVIPVALIVLPRQNAPSAAAVAAADLSRCQTTYICANGGTSIVAGDACRCVCANGFTGAHCDKAADIGCTTINVNSTAEPGHPYKNATLGSSIPRLLSAGQTNFSIPLNSSTILSLFSATNLSCSSENALVTFNSKSTRRRDALVSGTNPTPQLDNFPPSPVTLAPRAPDQTSSPLSVQGAGASPATAGIITSNGIIYAATVGASQTQVAAATATGASPANPSSSNSDGNRSISQTDFDFARVAVLFVLQEASVDAAVQAQDRLQGVMLGDVFQAGSVNVGNGVTIDFDKRTIDLGGGVVIGGKKGG